MKYSLVILCFLFTNTFANSSYLNSYGFLQNIEFKLYTKDIPPQKTLSNQQTTEEILMYDIIHAVWENGKWTAYTTNKTLLGVYKVGSPTIIQNSNGKKLFFIANFPGSKGGTDLYLSEFINGEWSKPRNMGKNINTPYNESNPGMLDENTLTYSTNGIIKKVDINTFVIDNGGDPQFDFTAQTNNTVANAQKLAEQKLAEQKLAEQKLAEQKLAEQKLAEQKLAEQKLAEQKLAEQKLAEQKLAELKLAEQKLAEQKLAEQKLAEQKLAEQKLAEQKLAEQKLAEQKLAEQKLAEQKLAEQKLAEQKLAEQKLAEQKLAEQKLAEQKLAEQKLAQAKAELEKKIAEQKLAEEQLAAAKAELEQKVSKQVVPEKSSISQDNTDAKYVELMKAAQKLKEEKLAEAKGEQTNTEPENLIDKIMQTAQKLNAQNEEELKSEAAHKSKTTTTP
ncbi:MAG TPA: cell envelope integrity protein TolA, partial [Chitinophagales bacterium]|nr:cell envelope integrity protein TolA [Chitinophagales bacterium]